MKKTCGRYFMIWFIFTAQDAGYQPTQEMLDQENDRQEELLSGKVKALKSVSMQGFSLIHVQLTLVISKLMGPFETLRDIRTSTYQICRIEETTN